MFTRDSIRSSYRTPKRHFRKSQLAVRRLDATRRLSPAELLECRWLLAADFVTLQSLGAVSPFGALIYESSFSGDLTDSGEVDTFTIDVDDGQTITVVVDPAAALRPRIELFDPLSTSLVSAVSPAAGEDVFFQPEATVGPGTYTVELSGLVSTTGSYSIELFLNSAIEAEGRDASTNDTTGTAQSLATSFITTGGSRAAVLGVADDTIADIYSFSLGDGQTATLAAKALNAGQISLRLFDSDGSTVLAAGVSSTNVDQLIDSYLDVTTDALPNSYFVEITGATGEPYSLLVGKDVGFDTEANDAIAPNAQEITLAGKALGFLAGSGSPGDFYEIQVTSGDVLNIETSTPSGGAFEFVNNLDPAIELYDPLGALVASDTNSLDDINAQLSQLTASSGSYSVHIFDENGTSGEYVLSISGHTGGLLPFAIDTTVPAENSVLGAALTQLTVNFGDTVLLSTVEANDLTVDLVAATGLTVVDGDTVIFDLPVLAEGVHDVAILAGAVTDLRGRSLQSFSGQLEVDLIGPIVVTSSVLEGDVLSSSGLTYTVQFDEDLDATNLDAADVVLTGQASGAQTATGFNYDALTSTLTVDYQGLVDDQYTLTLVSGDGAIEDLVGHDFDGEAAVVGTVPSGDGTAGGDFVVNFSIDLTGSIVVTSSVLEGDVLSSADLTYTVQFDEELDATNLDAADVVLTGLVSGAQTATGFNYDSLTSTLTVDYQGLVDDQYTLTLVSGDGAIEDLVGHDLDGEAAVVGTVPSGDGTAGGDFVVNFNVDLTGPIILASSLLEGDLLGTADITVTLQFNEELDATNLDAADVVLIGQTSGEQVATLINYHAPNSTLTIQYESLVDDQYELTLVSGDGAIKDVVGNHLDGEAALVGTVPSGDGIAGGDFVVNFGVDLTGPIVVASSVLEGNIFSSSDLTYTVQFDEELDATNLGAADVVLIGQVSGVQTSTGFSYDALTSTLTVDYQGLVEDQYSLTVVSGDGAIEDLAGNDLDGEAAVLGTVPSGDGTPGGDFVVNFSVDMTGPIVVASSVLEGDVLSSPDFTYTVVLDEELDATNLDATDIVLTGQSSGAQTATGFGYDALTSTLTIDYQGLVVDQYSLTLISGDEALEDLAGNDLDGEPAVVGTVPSGDGTPGGDFAVNFSVDLGPIVVASSVLEGDVHSSSALTYSVQFNEELDPTNLDAADVVLIGQASGAQTVTGFNYDALTFTLTVDYQGLVDDQYTLTLVSGDGAIEDLVGNDLDGEAAVVGTIPSGDGIPGGDFAVNFSVDLGPIVVASSVLEGDVHSSSQLTYTAQFNEELDATNLDAADVVLIGQVSGPQTIISFGYDALTSTLTVGYQGLVDDQYTLTLVSGDGAFEDLVGTDLDGEATPAGTVPSGDSTAGGHFVVSFSVNLGPIVVGSSILAGDVLSTADLSYAVQFNEELDATNLDAGDIVLAGQSSGVQTLTSFDYDPLTSTLTVDYLGLVDDQYTLTLVSGNGAIEDLIGIDLDGEVVAVGTIPSGDGTAGGDFVVNFTVDLTPPIVVASSVLAGERLSLTDLTYTVQFDEELIATNLDASDIMMVGQSSGVQTLTALNYDAQTSTLTLEFQGLVEDQYTLALVSGDGALEDLAGNDLDGEPAAVGTVPSGDGLAGGDFVVNFTIDLTAPTIIASSVLESDVLSSTTLAYVVQFDEELDATSLDAADVLLIGQASGPQIVSSIDYDALSSTLTVGYLGLVDDQYNLTLLSGSGAIEDLAGNNLDGEAAAVGTVPSGDGTPGGHFVVNFSVDLGPIVVASSVLEGDVLSTSDLSYTVQFNEELDAMTLDAADVVLTGQTSGVQTATGFNYDALSSSLTVDYQGLVNDQFTLTLVSGDGAIEDLAGIDLDGEAAVVGTIPSGDGTTGGDFVVQFNVDSIGPIVVTSSLLEGDILSFGDLTYTVQFDEELDVTNLDAADVVLIGQSSGVQTATGFSYDALTSTLTVDYQGLLEDQYTLTLVSGDGAIDDLAGNDLDGEAAPVGTVPSGDGAPGGDFVVNFDVDLTAPVVVSSSLLEGAALSAENFTYVVQFDEELIAASLDAADIVLVGQLSGPHSVASFNYDALTSTLTVDYQGLVDDQYTLTLVSGDGAIEDLAGNDLDGEAAAVGTVPSGDGAVGGNFVVNFSVDLIAPIVIGSSVIEGDVLLTPNLTYTIQFSEELDATNLDPSDIVLIGELSLLQTAVGFNYDAVTSTLTVDYQGLPEDLFTLTVISGDGAIEDLVGNDLDGEPALVGTVPSGNGLNGGDFVVGFRTNDPPADYPGPFEPKLPEGSLIYDPIVSGAIDVAGDTDSYTIAVDDGQTITVVLETEGTLQGHIELFDPVGVSIGNAAASVVGADAILQTVSTTGPGTYTVTLAGLSGTTGTYEAQIILNAAVEEESHGGPSNDTPATAEDINASFIEVTGARGAALGTMSVADVDFYQFTLMDGESSTLAVTGQTSDQFEIQLIGIDGTTLLASGLNTGNVSKIISRYTDTTTDGLPNTYFARVSGQDGQSYSLVVTRGADLDAESGDRFLNAQDISGTNGAFGHLQNVIGEGGNSGPLLGPISIVSSFPGPDYTGFIPPDPIAAAGPSEIVTMVNTDISVYDKLTASELYRQDLSGPDGFFGVVGATSNVFDPWVIFDAETDRFFAIAIEVANLQSEGNLYLAVSTDATPTTANDWHKYKLDFTHDATSTGLGTDAHFPDYPKLGVSADAIFVSGNYFPLLGGSGTYAGITAIEKAPLLAGGPANKLYEEFFTGFSVFPALQYGTGSTQYFAESSRLGGTTINIHAVADVLNSPTRTVTTLTVPAYDSPEDVPQLGGGQPADSVDARVMTGVMRDDSLWFAHGIEDPAIGDEEAVARWYEVDVSASATLVQTGNVDPGPGIHAWMPAVAVDGRGNMGIGFALAGPNQFLGAGFTGRLVSDQAGTTASPVTQYAFGEANYVKIDFGGRNRWGDYSGLSIDPTDDETFWVFNERASDSNTWVTEVASFRLENTLTEGWYQFEAIDGDTLAIATLTPADGPFDFLNELDPGLELYDPNGTLVASSNQPGNESLVQSVTAADAGAWRIRVVAAGETHGEYFLSVVGAGGLGQGPYVLDADPDDGSPLPVFPLTYTLDFSEAVLDTTVEADDLLIGGSPALAVTRIDGDTYRFDVDPAVNNGTGTYNVNLNASFLTDLQGIGVAGFAGSFTVDVTAPFIKRTFWNGSPLPATGLDEGPVFFAAIFSEDLVQTASAFKGPFTPSTDDILLVETITGSTLDPDLIAYLPLSDELRVGYNFLPEGIYSLTLVSGEDAIEDAVGHNLDGESLGPDLDGTPTGDGIFGGDYVVTFDVDQTTADAQPFERLQPLGGLMFGSNANTGLTNFANDTDDFTFFLEAGETVSARVATSDPGSIMSVELVEMPGVFSASSPGEDVILPATPVLADGLYTIQVTGSTQTTYSLDIFRNAALEDQVGDSDNGNELILNELSLDLGSSAFGAVGLSNPPTVNVDSLVWGVQPASGQIVKIDPSREIVVGSFSAPGNLLPNHTDVGLSIAEQGASLIYLNSDDDPNTLYRLDPETGAVLSTETPAFGTGLPYHGLSTESHQEIVTLFDQNFESGVGPGETVQGSFVINDTNENLNNGTLMMGHSIAYGSNDYSFYEFTIDLTEVNNAELTFDYVAEIEDLFDGVNVQASSQAINSPADLIVPIEGFTYDETRPLLLLGDVAYDGNGQLDAGTARFDLTALVGGPVNVRIQFQSDATVGSAGINIDDLQVTHQPPLVPFIFSANASADVDRLEGYAGTSFTHLDDGVLAINPVGGLGGDDAGRQFGFFSDGSIHEFDPNFPDILINSFAPPALDIEGLAFDGSNLYMATVSGHLYTLQPDSGGVLADHIVPGGPLFGLGALPTSSLTARELIVNGGFETGNLVGWTAADNGLNPSGPWAVAGAGGGFSGDSDPLEGDFSAFNGFAGDAGLEYELFQDVAIPAVSAATLTTNHRIQFDSLGNVSTQDRVLEISLRDTDNALLEILYTDLISLNGEPYTDLGWNTQAFDVSAYAGQNVRVHLREIVPEASTGPALIQFDDVSLLVPGLTAVVPEVDEYEFTLNGKVGEFLDVIFVGHDGANFENQVVELLDSSDNVLATASPNPLGEPGGGAEATNFVLGILDFVIPADDTYTLRLTSTIYGEYGIFIAESLTLEGEPNNALTAPLRSLDNTNAALGFLGSVGIGHRLFGVDAATNEVVELQPTTGVELNRFGLPTSATGGGDALAFDGSSLYYAAGSAFGGDDILYELDPNSGELLDSDAFSALGLSGGIDGLGAFAGQLIASDAVSGEVFFIDLSTDAKVGSWTSSVPIEGGVTGAGSRGTVFASDAATGQVFELAAGTGTLLNSFALPAGNLAGLAFVNESLFVADSTTGNVSQLNPDTGALLNTFSMASALSTLGGDNSLGISPTFPDIPTNSAQEGPTVIAISPSSRTVEDLNITQLIVDFSEPVTVVSAEDPQNYQLLGAGANDIFEGGNGDDIVFAVTPLLDVSQQTVTLDIAAAAVPLPPDRYQLTLDGDSSVLDLDGNSLNSVTDFGGGSDHVHQFNVVSSFSAGGDVYQLEVLAGTRVLISTSTPLDNSNGPSSNSLDPLLIVYDPSGIPIASDNDSLDGKNAILSIDALVDGAHVIQVLGQSGRGEYLLNIEFVADGDFDDNGVYNCQDVDALVAAIAAGSTDSLYDLSRDGVITIADLDVWLAEAATANASPSPYLGGDANLDGSVDALDFGVWAQHQFTFSAAWCTGDFNANGSVDVRDFNVWNANKFLSSGLNLAAGHLSPGSSETVELRVPRAALPSNQIIDAIYVLPNQQSIMDRPQALTPRHWPAMLHQSATPVHSHIEEPVWLREAGNDLLAANGRPLQHLVAVDATFAEFQDDGFDWIESGL